MTFGSVNPRWPLRTSPKAWTKGGSFGAHRNDEPDDREHQGIDLGAPYGTPVLAVEDGTIAAKDGWSGAEAVSLYVDHDGDGYANTVPFTALYGAIKPGSHPPIGAKVKKGDQIAVLGRYPGGSTMLHWEAWVLGTRPKRPTWKDGATKPAALYDPTDYLTRAMENPDPFPADESTGGGGALAVLGVVGAVAVVGGVAWWVSNRRSGTRARLRA